MEDEVIASQLEDLVKPVLLVQQKYYQQLGPAKPNSQPTFNGSCCIDFTVAKRSRGNGTNSNVSLQMAFYGVALLRSANKLFPKGF